MDPLSLLIASACFIGAEVARKPADLFANMVWRRVCGAMGWPKDQGTHSEQGLSISRSDLCRIIEQVPGLTLELAGITDRYSALRRAILVEKVLRGATLLWVDDHPESTEWERATLSDFGVESFATEDTAAALDFLRSPEGASIDLIISDIARGHQPSAGIDGLEEIRWVAPDIPVIFYVGLLSPQVPLGAQGITNEPNELLHLILDQLERRRI